MSLLGALFFELLMLAEVTRRFRFLTAVHLILLYIIGSQIVFYFGFFLVDYPGPESRLAYIYNVDLGIGIYFVIAVITYSATAFIWPPVNFSTKATVLRMVDAASRFVPYIAVFSLTYVIFQLAVIDYESMMFHAWYGAAPPRFNSTALSGVFKLYALVAIVSAVTLPLALRAKSGIYSIILAVTTAWLFLYALSSSSRGAAVMVFVLGAAWLAVARRRQIAILAFNSVLLILVLRIALQGRGMGEFGLLALPNLISSAFDLSGDMLRGVIANVFQGIFVTTDGFTLNAVFNPLYAWLSFSPMPSTFDGFDTILRASEIRLGLYVPMSAITEAYMFGPACLAVAITGYWIAVRLSALALSKGYVSASLFSSLFLFAVFVQANAYPMRNVFRQVLIAILINVVAMVLFKSSARKHGPALRGRMLPAAEKAVTLVPAINDRNLPPIRW